MRRHPRGPAARPLRILALAAVTAFAAACGAGGTTPTVVPSASAAGPTVIPLIIGSHEAGPSRFVFSFVDPVTNQPIATPDRAASVAFVPPGQTEPGAAVPAEFVWAIEGERGMYVAQADFPAAGAWKAVFTTSAPDAPEESIGVSFDVQEELPTVDVGSPAPASDTPTATDVGGDLARVSTDTDPDPAFYELSVADALGEGTPFVLVFATPAFCQSAQCGPTLDHVKNVVAAYPDLTIINVEPYQLQVTATGLQPATSGSPPQLVPVQSVLDWGITSEPWIFVVGKDGIVTGSFEGIIAEDELKASIDEVLAG